MKPILSICIPTYNRENYLRECLESVLPQVKGRKDVEAVVIDDASEDNTASVLNEFLKSYPSLRHYRNPTNLGYAGNHVKCIEYATGDYMALLCDDDVYLDGQIARMLSVVSVREYAFIGMNYCSFVKKINKPDRGHYAPVEDVLFERAYDVLNYPGVGHWSGFIFNTRLSKQILKKQSFQCFEKSRTGIVVDLAARSTLSSNLPAYFIGEVGLAARRPMKVDYDTLHHLCLEFYEYWYNLFKEGLITEKDLEHRLQECLQRLPRAIIGGTPDITREELIYIIKQFSQWFKGNKKFDLICVPLLYGAKYQLIRLAYKLIKKSWRLIKRLSYLTA